METSIIKIGNSKGLIIPKQMLDKFGASRKIEIQVKDGGLFILPVNDIPRKGWEKAFAKACKSGSQSETDPFYGIENDFDKEEWTW